METFYPNGTAVIVTAKHERTKSVYLSPTVEGKEPEAKEEKLVEISKHIVRVVKRKYVSITLRKDNNTETLFDGFVYLCDDGSAYYPDFEQNGQTFSLAIATDEERAIYE